MLSNDLLMRDAVIRTQGIPHGLLCWNTYFPGWGTGSEVEKPWEERHLWYTSSRPHIMSLGWGYRVVGYPNSRPILGLPRITSMFYLPRFSFYSLSYLMHSRLHSSQKYSKVKSLLPCFAAAAANERSHVKNRHCLSGNGHCYKLYLDPGFFLVWRASGPWVLVRKKSGRKGEISKVPTRGLLASWMSTWQRPWSPASGASEQPPAINPWLWASLPCRFRGLFKRPWTVRTGNGGENLLFCKHNTWF